MKKRLFIYTTLILFAGLLGFFLVSVFITHRNNLSIAKSTVMEITRISAGLFCMEIDFDDFVSVGTDTRITVIADDGEILADSHPPAVSYTGNRLLRPEIVSAAVGFPEVHVRFSDSQYAEYIYYALRVPVEDTYVFVRVAIPVAQIDAYLIQSLPLLLFLLIIVVFACFIMIHRVVNVVLAPFSSIENNLRLLFRGQYTKIPAIKSFREIESITRGIDDIALRLQENYATIRNEKDKLAYILDSISDGLFVVDENNDLTLVNAFAYDIFSTTNLVGKKVNYLVSDKNLTKTIEECINAKEDTFLEFIFKGKIYFTSIKRLPGTDLTMVVMNDVTEIRESSKRREEFFANASHELKTPLTAIRGFNELTSLNNKDIDLEKYINGITRETNRMTTLIGDMLKLSELDNQKKVKDPISVKVNAVASEVKDVMSGLLENKNISMQITGDTLITARPEHIYEVIKNLVENAVLYTNNDGYVNITIDKNAITISDNGIGIPSDEQSKIFERFYRVEKSRDTKSGGTGLGLPIVKHTCALYGWKLALHSRPGIGTDVIITFQQ